MSSIQLIVGLGNPGAEYEATRHNAGAWFVLQIAALTKVTLRYETKYHGLHATTSIAGHDCHLLIPTTFMNRSGQSVKALSSYYKIPAAAMLIAHDEIDLPTGIIRLKFDGGHGGHNGLRDIMQHLDSKQFYRLRIGVGHPGHSKEVEDYVLNPPRKTEREEIDGAMLRAEKVLPLILGGEMQKVMNTLHGEKS